MSNKDETKRIIEDLKRFDWAEIKRELEEEENEEAKRHYKIRRTQTISYGNTSSIVWDPATVWQSTFSFIGNDATTPQSIRVTDPQGVNKNPKTFEDDSEDVVFD